MGAYLELIRQQKQNDQQETELRTNMMAAAETDPDSLARAKKSADMLGLPLQAVQERLPEVEKQAFVEGFGYKDLIRNAPKTAAWLQEDTLHAGVSKDDLENLSMLESVMARVEASGRSLAAGPLRMNASLWGIPRAGADIVSELLTGPLADVGVLPEDVGAKASQYFTQKQAGAAAATDFVRGDMSKFGPRERAMYSGIESAGQTLTALPAAIATGNPSILLGTLSASTGGEAYGQARDKGIHTAQALNFAASQAAVEYATERLPVGALFRDLGLKRSFSRVLANQLITEMPQEQIATVLQDLNEWAVLHPEKPFSEYIAARPEAAIQTAIATAVGTGLQTSVATAVDTAVNGPRHKQAEEVFKAIGDTATNSKLRERLPEKFKELAERYAGSQNAFIDAGQFNQYFQSVGIDPQAVASELGVRNYFEAVTAGTDLVIPMGNFAARLAPTDHLQGLMQDLKLSQGELSAREYEAQQANAAEHEQEIAGQAETAAPDASRQQIFDDVMGQLVGRYERSTAEAYATQYTAGIATMAERMGMEPLELHQRYGLTITSPLPEILTKRADLDTIIDPMLDAIRAGNLPTDEQVNGPALIEFLRERGIQDEGGELAARDANLQTPKGKRKLVRDDGLPLDTARELAAEAGYIDADSTVSDFLDLLDNELRGQPVYSMRNRNDSMGEQQSALRELARWVDQQGIDLNAVDNSVIKRMMHPERDGREFEQSADPLLTAFDEADLIELQPRQMTEQEINDDETSFLSSFPAGTRYPRDTRLLKRIRRASDAATDELAGSPETNRRSASKLGPFTGYQVTAEVLPPDSFNPNGHLAVRVFGDEQLQQDITDEAALTFTVSADGELTVNGPSPSGETFQLFKQQGWADLGRDAAGEPQPGWSTLAAGDGPLPISEIIPLLADVHARVKLWKQADHVGLHWSRATGALGGLPGMTDANATAVYFQGGVTGDQTQTPEFLNWFGESKVVDAEGKPLVVYHGTTADIEQFKQNKATEKDSGWYGTGIYMTADPSTASAYSGYEEMQGRQLSGTPRVMPLYVSLQNPYVWPKGRAAATTPEEAAATRAGLEDAGYDGVIVPNEYADPEYAGHYEVIAFHPEQIKSATGNRGTFDPKNPNILYQAAFHGSPYKFDKFTTDHIGTGEGAQAYGWGLYFAGNKEVAEFYREQLREPDVVNNWSFGSVRLVRGAEYQDYSPRDSSNQQQAKALLSEDLLIEEAAIRDAFSNGNIEAARSEMLRIADERIEQAREEQPVIVAYLKVLREKIETDLKFDVLHDPGQLYEVQIPEDDTLLLWDKPLSEQPEKVRTALLAADLGLRERAAKEASEADDVLAALGQETGEGAHGDMPSITGEKFYHELTRKHGSDEAASKYLHSLGINGIKYLDGSSRSQGEGHHNYVIFDDSAIDILRTYYQREQDGARGYIRIGDNQRISIALLERANLSTFLHETGHMWLEVLGDLASQENAPEQIKQDYRTILDWFGIESRDQIQVEHHELFARGNEAYLMDGKSPSSALRAVFQRFKAWLTMIYRSISRLDVQLTPEVRAVFDRIYASDEEIEAARAESGMMALFSSAEQMGLTDAEFAAYRSTVTDASVVAQDKLRAEMMDEYQREQTKWWNEERAKIREQVTAEVNAQPVYQAFDALVSGAQGKLSKADLIRRYGDAYLKRFKRGYGDGKGAVYATDGGGMDIDLAAEIFGYESGDALVQALVNIRPRNELIEAETDARMREQYGDMRLDGTIADRAEHALHNDLRADVLMTELRALRRKQREVAPFVQAERTRQRGERTAARTAAEGVPPVEYFRNAARGLVSQQAINELQPHRYLLAERKASRKAFEAMAKGDPNVAASEKQRELLNHFLYLESTAAQERAEKIAAYAEGLSKRSTQERIGKAGEEYLDALNEILAAYQFRQVPKRQLQLIAKVRAAVAAADAEGEIIDVMLDEQGNVIDPALLNVRNFRELTIDELEAVRDMLKNIEHVAREKNKFRTAEVQAEFDEIAGKVLDEIADGKPAKPIDVYKLRDPRHQKWRAIPLAITEWRGLFSYIQEVVGFKQNSTLWNYVMRPLNDAAAREAVMKREAAEKLDELFKRYKTDYLYGKGRVIPGVGAVNKQQQLMVAASYGTETGRQRMLDNGFDGRGLSQEQVDSILDSLDERDWGFVQDLWKLFDGYWKPVADKQQRVTGVRPQQVDPVPFMTKFGEMAGGYSPIAYESFLDNRAAAQQAAQIADEMKRAAYTRNTTRRGFLKERVQRIQGKAVRYDFGVIYKHLNEVIHDVTHHETLRDVQKLMNHKLDGRSILDEITQRMGYGVRDQIVDTLEEIAVGDLRVMGSSERIMEHLAAGASIAGLAYNVWNAVQNLTGISNSIAVIGPSAVMRGAWEWIGTPQHMLESIDTVQEKSEFMRTRYLNMNRDINAMRGRLEQHTGRPAVDDAYAAFRDSGFWMMIRIQQLVDMPTWIGAYDQAKRDMPDITEANAAALADQAVLAAQGGGRTVDLSKFMRGKGWARVWTVFAGYFNVTYQRTVESMKRAGVEGYTPASVGRMVADMFFLMMAPAAMTVILKQAIDTLVGGDDDDAEEWATKYFKEQVSYILAMFPFVRETTAAVAGYANYSGPVGARFFADVNKFIQQVWQGEVDENLVKAGVRVAGTPLGIPTGQIIKTYDGMDEAMAGNATPIALVFGPPKP